MGCAVAADIFAITLESTSDEGIGQSPSVFSNYVDVLSPMIYTYTYRSGWKGWDNPNDHATELVTETLDAGIPKLEGPAMYRPWIQRAFLETPRSFSCSKWPRIVGLAGCCGAPGPISTPASCLRRNDSRAPELTAEIIGCRRCPRLVAWREQVAANKRVAFIDEEYWGRPVPGFGDPARRACGRSDWRRQRTGPTAQGECSPGTGVASGCIGHFMGPVSQTGLNR